MTIKEKVIAINKLLSDVEQRSMRLSYLLADMEFSEDSIKFIADNLLSETVDNFLDSLTETLINCRDGQRLFRILDCVYGLNGNKPKTLRDIGDELEISRERVRQLKIKAIRKIKSHNNREKWRSLFKIKTGELLASNSSPQNNKLEEDKLEQHMKPVKQYHFSVDNSGSGSPHITIRSNIEGNHTAQITITEETVGYFCDELVEIISSLGWQNKIKIKKNHSLEAIKKEYIQAYEPWTPEEEQTLVTKFEEGLSNQEIAYVLKRQPSAIGSRLNKLGLE